MQFKLQSTRTRRRAQWPKVFAQGGGKSFGYSKESETRDRRIVRRICTRFDEEKKLYIIYNITIQKLQCSEKY